MIGLSESEARTKLCPFIHDVQHIPDVTTIVGPRKCAASECMAWRWYKTRKPLSLEQFASSVAWLLLANQPTVCEGGYCGAAGKISPLPPANSEEDAA